MGIFKRKYTMANGKSKTASNYSIEFRDHDDMTRRVTGFSDKSASLELERQLKRLVASRMVGVGPDAESSRFLETCPNEIMARLGEWGIIEPARAATGRRLPEHVDGWLNALTAKGNSKEYVTETTAKILRLATACRWRSLSDITAVDFDGWRVAAKAGGMSSETANMYLSALRNFCNWLVREKLLVENPVRHLAKWNAEADRSFERRDYSVDELSRFLAAAAGGKKHHGLTGPARALLYRTAFSTGLRWSELRSLERNSFDFEANTVTVLGAYTKNGKTATLPIPPDLSDDLRDFMRLYLPTAKAFKGMWKGKGAQMLREDMKAAKVEPLDEFGNKGDFHSFRHTYGTMLAKAGVSLTMAQKMMRHSTPVLTSNLYTHLRIEDEARELAKLPTITPVGPEEEAARKTGTDDAAGHGFHVSALVSKPADLDGKVKTYTDDRATIDDKIIPKNSTSSCMPKKEKTLVSQDDTRVENNGGRYWTRTSDPYNVSVVLYQLS